MGMPVRIDDTLYEQARTEAQIEHRTIAGQIEYWAGGLVVCHSTIRICRLVLWQNH